MVVQRIAYGSVDERKAAGKQACKRTPPSAHAGWRSAGDRPDPAVLLEAWIFAHRARLQPAEPSWNVLTLARVIPPVPRAASNVPGQMVVIAGRQEP